MTLSHAAVLRAELGWDRPLAYRRGAPQRLCGIALFYDFAWAAHFTDERAQFVGGKSLAEQVIEDCPRGKRPALLLTDREVEERAYVTDRYYVVVVNLPKYTESAQDPSTAAAYMARRLGRGITGARSFSQISQEDAAEVALWLDANLNAKTLRQWAGNDADRLQTLREIGDADAATETSERRIERAVSELQRLDRLDPRLVEAIVGLIAEGSDFQSRVELLWALTEDDDGRLRTAEVLHARLTERLTDARLAADEFDHLLETSGETDVQRFLEQHPWLLGLDYACIRARPSLVRGEVDFLLERFDGFHDLLELKSPGDLGMENQRATPAAGPGRLAFSKREAADAPGVSVDFLEQHVMHELRVVRRGRRRLIPVRELERWLDQNAARVLDAERLGR